MTLFKKIQWFCNLIRLRSYYKFLLLIAYTAFGAWLFRTYELQADIKRRSVFGNTTNLVRRQLAERWIEMHKDAVLRNDSALRFRRAAEAVEWLLDELNLSDHIRDLSEETPWTWTGAMFYAGQLYTTIGYGYPTTKTDEGRICTIFYALFGIPCFLMYLKSIGKTLSKKMKKYYKKLRRSRVGRILLPTRVTAMKDGFEDPEAAEERKKKPFPIPIAIIMLIIWICFSASMFCIWEDTWVFSSAVYFFIVSISTVGLGDMLFRTPDMMVFNFLLILVGLALLSMCFELITDRVAKWKQKRFDEHIKKVQKMAFQVFEKDPFIEEAPPLGIRMAPNLMQIAATHVSEEKRGFFAEFKDWFAGKVTDNVIQSKLEDSDDESDSEEALEEFDSPQIATVTANDLIVCSNGAATRRVSKQSYALSDISNLSNSKILPGNNYGQLLDRIKAMEKFKPKKNDLDSRMFAKFLENKKLAKILEQTELRELATVSCQTDLSGLVVQRRNPKGRHARIGSCSSQSTMSTLLPNKMHAPDEDSVMSFTFGDLKFDYKTEPFIDEYYIRESNHSIFDFDEDETVRIPQKMLISRPGMPPPPPSRPLNLASPLRTLLEKEQKYDEDPEIQLTPRRLNSLSDIQARKVKLGVDENLQHARLVCGLLPQDFDSPSTSTSTSMIDSGYELSKRDASTMA
ncbi:TWiK family of potassium channels protein 12 [Caenorhabditis elegans]|uniref:TWiK family of potassium channels protein 12 n=1 Tax=Caenorhabditis elegans TaxID=6239 RepID=UPI000327B002|nr:TWiK family of potassium channels protein 12 [Caenorhabditis elegans]CAA98271.3 TWiK family of potassium channels protein 12 [Caenorhabditis elegans]|eukprot:NP_505731.3 TWiK family of potassium channels protein 12 [Caenorhabditis elegans]